MTDPLNLIVVGSISIGGNAIRVSTIKMGVKIYALVAERGNIYPNYDLNYEIPDASLKIIDATDP